MKGIQISDNCSNGNNILFQLLYFKNFIIEGAKTCPLVRPPLPGIHGKAQREILRVGVKEICRIRNANRLTQMLSNLNVTRRFRNFRCHVMSFFIDFQPLLSSLLNKFS